MKIEATRTLNKNGDEMYYIKSISGAATRDMLPNEYLEGDHVVKALFGDREGIHLSRGKSIVVGSNMTRVEFETSLLFVKACGNRLHEINKKIAEKRKAWKGTETFDI